MNRRDTRTGSWALDSRWRLRMDTTRGGWVRAASSTVITATATKANSSNDVRTGSFLVSRRATATMGPNSPTVPMAEM